MTIDWKQKIEAQIAALNSLVPEEPDGDGFYGELYEADAADVYDAARAMQALLDVAVTAEVVQLSIDGDEVDCPFCAYDGLQEALDKLREVGDE